jgi:hypothetical protein
MPLASKHARTPQTIAVQKAVNARFRRDVKNAVMKDIRKYNSMAPDSEGQLNEGKAVYVLKADL